jgi:hypothetical protein
VGVWKTRAQKGRAPELQIARGPSVKGECRKKLSGSSRCCAFEGIAWRLGCRATGSAPMVSLRRERRESNPGGLRPIYQAASNAATSMDGAEPTNQIGQHVRFLRSLWSRRHRRDGAGIDSTRGAASGPGSGERTAGLAVCLLLTQGLRVWRITKMSGHIFVCGLG